MASNKQEPVPRMQGMAPVAATVIAQPYPSSSSSAGNLPLAPTPQAYNVGSARPAYDVEQGGAAIEMRPYPIEPSQVPAPIIQGSVVKAGNDGPARCCTMGKCIKLSCIALLFFAAAGVAVAKFMVPCKSGWKSAEQCDNERSPCYDSAAGRLSPGCEVLPDGSVYYPTWSNDPWTAGEGHAEWYHDGPFWTVKGNCTIDGNNNRCISQTNTYENNESCDILALQQGVIHSAHFETERNFDFFTIDGVQYHGESHQNNGNSYGPDNVSVGPDSVIRWTTDSSVQKMGWRICLTPDSENYNNNQVSQNVDATNGNNSNNSVGVVHGRAYCASNTCASTGGWMHHTVGCGTVAQESCWNSDNNYVCCLEPPTEEGLLDAPWQECAREHASGDAGRCDCPGGQIRYGINDTWSSFIVGPVSSGLQSAHNSNSPVPCNNSVFGDPVPGTGKVCECKAAAVSQGGDTVAPTVFWQVAGDACANAVVTDEPACISHQGGYANRETCSFTVLVAGSLDVRTFSTERNYDKVNVKGQLYHGTSLSDGPGGVQVEQAEVIGWTSDSSVTFDGFKICIVDSS